jgi:DNA-binding FrmR family transcriptional regulator
VTDETTSEILQRLKSIEGHVRGIQRMVESEEYCIDIMNQVLAVQRALQKVNRVVLDRHLHTCVANAMRSQDGAERERVIGEIMSVFEAGRKG